jgi:formamidopyrimidine-DNA glycosylase
VPELPEVESLARELSESFQTHETLVRVHCLRPDLRFPMPIEELESLQGLRFSEVTRRAKYLLFRAGTKSLLSHLGMTGTWRFESDLRLQVHDHLALQFSSGRYLIYNDPRRFGYVDVISTDAIGSSRWLKHLGPEPLDPHLKAMHLQKHASGSSVAIKLWIMDQKNLVGVGNIYASEALFRAKISPLKAASRVSNKEWSALLKAVREVLQKAIAGGGTTLRDYRRLSGDKGGHQSHLSVYDREALPCIRCKTKIRMKVMGGRSTYWCPKCQKGLTGK